MAAVVTRIGNDWYFATEQFTRSTSDRRLLTFNRIPLETAAVFASDADGTRLVCVDGIWFAFVPTSEIRI